MSIIQGELWADDEVYETITSNDDIWYEPDKETDKYKEIKWTYYGKPIDNNFNIKIGGTMRIQLEKGVFKNDIYEELRNKIEELYKIPVLEARYGLSVDELIQCIVYGLSPNFKTPVDMQIYLHLITSKKEFKRNVLKDPGVLYQIAMYKMVKV